jgi:NADP-dependent 3-hydroxy acid dehydrogenase YdfG
MKGQLDGKVGLVTGASSGIGRATAIAVLKQRILYTKSKKWEVRQFLCRQTCPKPMR